ncbi:hypothetical protein DPMN_031525 [Dreissena polymorpha]|uniref:Fibronectin type-III domain-containing protein n=1 Tax=Dreissena polymorpha TaxID=45954 RepID=A0A9D4RJE5_DREPO|nr:hypothetical protein DPMN_031525 [Dreissena polymorpha]
MSFYTQAYPAPLYVWQTCKGTCTNITNGFKYNTSSNGLLSNLTILNVTNEDYGEYRVIVSNGIGQAWTESFQLIPYDRPTAPINFHVIENTQKEATVAWTPSFNGGVQQTFLILYRINQEGPWINISVKDTGDIMINLTIRGLVPNTKYQTYMYAQNIIGSSMKTYEISFVTLKGVDGSSSASPNTGAIVGGTVGGLLIILTVVLVILGLRRYHIQFVRKQDSSNNAEYETTRTNTVNTGEYDELSQSHAIRGYDPSEAAKTYELLDAVQSNKNQYSPLSEHQISGAASMYEDTREASGNEAYENTRKS